MKAGKLFVFVLIGILWIKGFSLGLVGKSAPDILIKEWITSNPPDTTRLDGRVYVLEFWAMWCHPCVENIPHLIALNKKYKEKDLIFIGLSQDKSASKVRNFVSKKGINYHIAMDNGTTNWYQVTGYPTAVVVNHEGKVVWQGYPWKKGFEEAIAKAIEAGPPPLVSGVDLGEFKRYKQALWGGKEFASAYHKIESNSNKKDSKTSSTAKKIVETINQRIVEKIKFADNLRSKNPAEAYSIYAEIVSKYDGIETVLPAKMSYIEMENSEKFRNRLLAAKSDTK